MDRIIKDIENFIKNNLEKETATKITIQINHDGYDYIKTKMNKKEIEKKIEKKNEYSLNQIEIDTPKNKKQT